MKSLITLLFTVITLISHAQIPEGFSYQVALRDEFGLVLADTDISLRLTIFHDLLVDETLYTETHNVSTNQFGLVNVVIGQGTPEFGVFSDLTWEAPYSLKVEFDSGQGFMLAGTEPLQSVPYAMKSKLNWSTTGNSDIDINEDFLGTTNDTPLKIQTSGSTRMLISKNISANDTKIGINTDAPGYFDNVNFGVPIGTFLHLNSNVASSRIIFSSSNSPHFHYVGINLDGANFTTSSDGEFNWGKINGAAYLMTLTSNGDLSTGGAGNPLAHLHVNGDNWHVRMSNEESATSNYWTMGASAGGWAIGDGKFAINNSTSSSTSKFVIENTGQTGIGTTTPDYLLEVNGSAAKPGGGSWTNPSDIRLKYDVSAFNEGLKEILEINPVRYKYIAQTGFDSSVVHTGIIAQELQKIMPEMVSSLPMELSPGIMEEYLSVDPSAFTYMLINAIQELKEENDLLKGQMTAIKVDYDKRLQAIEKTLYSNSSR